jgi:Ca2+-transporting ATPase
MENDSMLQEPRPITATFFSWKELTTSVIQGLMITVGTLGTYQYAVQQGFDEATTRTMVFVALISANIVLTLVNRSFRYSILTTLKYKNNLVPLIIAITLGITALLLFVPTLTTFFKFSPLSGNQLLISTGAGFLSVLWYELVKWDKRSKLKD